LLPFSSGFWYDSRLRCDVADLYFKLYGRKRPQALPIPELAMLRQPMMNQIKPEKTKQEKFTIPKAEKRKILPDQEPEGKPVQFSGTVEARTVSQNLKNTDCGWLAESNLPKCWVTFTEPNNTTQFYQRGSYTKLPRRS